MEGFASRHVFQTPTSCLSLARCSSLAMWP
jgi:hypothetical protein